MQAVKLVGDLPQVFWLEQIPRAQAAPAVKRFDAAAFVVIMTARGYALIGQCQEHALLGRKIEDGVVLARQAPVKHRLGFARGASANTHGKRGKAFRVVEFEIVDG